MDPKLVGEFEEYFRACKILPDKPLHLCTWEELDAWLSSGNYGTLAVFLLNTAARHGSLEGTRMLIKHAAASGFLLEELFAQEQFDIIHILIESGTFWGSAHYVLEKNKHKYEAWCIAHHIKSHA